MKAMEILRGRLMDFTLSTITECLQICMTIVYWQNLISVLIRHAKYFCVIISQDQYISSLRFIAISTYFMTKLLCKYLLSCIVINLEYLVIIYNINCIPYYHKNWQRPLNAIVFNSPNVMNCFLTSAILCNIYNFCIPYHLSNFWCALNH